MIRNGAAAKRCRCAAAVPGCNRNAPAAREAFRFAVATGDGASSPPFATGRRRCA
jgi:hypothetical protein